MLNLFSEDVRRDPYPLLGQLRSTSPVLPVPQADLWMAFDHESVKRALHDTDAFSSAAAPPGGKPLDWIIFNDPPRHTKLRALVTRAFTPRVVAGMEPRIRALSQGILDAAVPRGEMDVAVDLAIPLPILVIAELIGIPAADRPVFTRWSDVILRLSDTVAGGEAAAQAGLAYRQATTEMSTYLAGLVGERRTAPKDDLLTHLVEAEVDGERLTPEELLGFFQLLLVAGTETTTNLIGNAILCFAEHPDQLDRLRAAPELLPAAIEEVLRYRSPVQAVFRKTQREVTLHGQTIPGGKLVLAFVGSANRDPAQFPDPDRFDITRAPGPHLAFGHGIHFCLGAPLARLEARVALGDFFARVPRYELTADPPWEPRKTFHIHGPVKLPIRFPPAQRGA